MFPHAPTHSLPPHLSFPLLPTPFISWGTFVTMDEPILIHYYELKSIVYIRVPSLCCTFYRFWQIYNALYSPRLYHTEEFHCSKNSLCFTSPHLPPLLPLPRPWKPLIVLLFYSLVEGILFFVQRNINQLKPQGFFCPETHDFFLKFSQCLESKSKPNLGSFSGWLQCIPFPLFLFN